MKKYLALFSVVFLLLAVFTGCAFMGNVSGVARFEAIDENEIEFIQMQPPQPGDKIGVIETSMGTIKFRLFPVQSPLAVENFTKMAETGKYTDYVAYKITTKRAFIAAKNDGSGMSVYGEPFANQYSPKLWNFPGAVGSISDQPEKGDSRFYIVGNCEISDQIFAEMKQNNFPQKVISQYEQVGGCPELDWACNIFGQVFEGLEIVDAINGAETDEQGFPKEEIKILSVRVETYQPEESSSEPVSAGDEA